MDNLTRCSRTDRRMSPFNAWVLLKSLETLAVRVRRDDLDSAATLAVALAEHPKISRLIYPGQPDLVFPGGSFQKQIAVARRSWPSRSRAARKPRSAFRMR